MILDLGEKKEVEKKEKKTSVEEWSRERSSYDGECDDSDRKKRTGRAKPPPDTKGCHGPIESTTGATSWPAGHQRRPENVDFGFVGGRGGG